MPGRTRPREIRRRRQRKQKLASLRLRHGAAKTDAERNRILTKIGRVAPYLAPAEFLAAAKPKVKVS